MAIKWGMGKPGFETQLKNSKQEKSEFARRLQQSREAKERLTKKIESSNKT